MKIVLPIPDDCDLYGPASGGSGRDIPGSVMVGSWGECKDKCNADARCVAVTFINEHVRVIEFSQYSIYQHKNLIRTR